MYIWQVAGTVIIQERAEFSFFLLVDSGKALWWITNRYPPPVVASNEHLDPGDTGTLMEKMKPLSI